MENIINAFIGSTVFYVIIGWGVISLFIIINILKKDKILRFKFDLMQQQNIAKIDAIRKEHLEALEILRVEAIKRNDERNRQWAESEKETLHVLNGVSNLLDLSEKIDSAEAETIINKLDEIQNKLNLNQNNEILNKLDEIQNKLALFIESN